MTEEKYKLTEIQYNTLKEVTSLGIQKATFALEQMVDKEIGITVPDVKLIPFQEVSEYLGGGESEIVGLYLKMLGDISGSVLLAFSKNSAYTLAGLLVGEDSTETEYLSELGKSALKEMGNILTNTYLNIMAEMMEVNTFPSIPHFAEDMLGAIIDFILIEISEVSDYALIVKTKFSVSNVEIDGNFLIFPNKESISLMFKKMGIE
ncbi:MAG: chemotaxis protein CheC [Elusimicrobiota bacterium]